MEIFRSNSGIGFVAMNQHVATFRSLAARRSFDNLYIDVKALLLCGIHGFRQGIGAALHLLEGVVLIHGWIASFHLMS
ncbi:NADH dehydrogenase subunit A [Fulvimarina pelagi HTCC2506]|uniref:NADH dehydrogenase subunit A n=1 Tax=Fulvimarina pelagi HTCC2506 TaxID=314231 RepID=Q0FZA5_9HYPH|nr:NADH dehydrogenase subunit A [Fulvimarina pelagi HTCC2506]